LEDPKASTHIEGKTAALAIVGLASANFNSISEFAINAKKALLGFVGSLTADRILPRILKCQIVSGIFSVNRYL
jgi:hypothetical protein